MRTSCCSNDDVICVGLKENIGCGAFQASRAAAAAATTEQQQQEERSWLWQTNAPCAQAIWDINGNCFTSLHACSRAETVPAINYILSAVEQLLATSNGIAIAEQNVSAYY